MDHRQVELLRELEIPLVVRGHGHDRSGAVAHHDVVGDPDGDLFLIHRVDGVSSGEDAGLVLVEVAAVHVGLARAVIDVGGDGGLLPGGRDRGDERVLRREDHVSGSEKGVGPGREDSDLMALDVEVDLSALAFPDPVFLQQLDALGPVERFEFVDETLGVAGDAQHPLAQGAALDGVAFGFPFLDFLVGEDSAEVGRPVHGRFVDEGEAHGVDLLAGPAFGLELGNGLSFFRLFAKVGMIELEKDPLGPADVAGVGRVDLAVPVVGEADRLELAAEVDDVGLGRDARVLTGLDRILLGGQAEGVPAHGV